uniref:TSA: Wollemia nobilis Ref_Wollemi_Transcript_8406_2366 transcribed RNA sequence n=1 Tax=Wollemia nobilis TaxID=56998 RepID=A0A0C9RNG1_9CONI
MAGGMMVDSGVRKGRAQMYEGHVTNYVVFACIVAATGGSLFGYDLGVSGGVTSMDDFLKKFFPGIYRRKQHNLHETDYCKYDNQLLTLFTSSLYFAGLVSTFGASYVTRNYGRRISILVGGTSFFFGGAINAGAENIAMLIIGRILLGIGIGFGNQAVPLYLSEMAPPKIRGGANNLFQLTTCVGIFVANVINYFTNKIHPWGWRLSLGLAVVPALLMVLGGIFLPETPNSLVEQGRLEEGRVILEKIRGTKNVHAEFDDLVEASEIARSVQHPFRNLLERKNRPQLVVACCIPAFQQLTGNNSFLFYAPVIFQSLGMGSDASLYSAIMTGAVITVGAIVSMCTVDRLGRRFLFLEAGVQLILCHVIISILLALKFGKGEKIPTGYGVGIVLLICVFTVGYGWSWGPLGWLVPSEILQLETRSAGQSVVVCINLFFTAAIAQSFLAMLCHLKYGIFLLFAGLVFIMSVFIYFFLPETKNVPIEEMRFEWEKHWYWKRIVKDAANDDRHGNDFEKTGAPKA